MMMIMIDLQMNLFREFTSTQFLLRRYTDLRWDKTLNVSTEQLLVKGIDHAFQVSSKYMMYGTCNAVVTKKN